MGLSVMTVPEPQLDLIPSTWTTRRIILGTLVVLLVVVAFLLLYRFRLVAVIVFSGIVVSMAMAPSIDWLHQHGLSRSVSVILIYLVLLIALISFIVLLVPPIIEQLTATAPQIEKYYLDLKMNLQSSPLLALRQIASQLPTQINVMPVAAASPAASSALDTVGQALATLGTVLSGLLSLTAILLIGFDWTLEEDRALRTLISPLSNEKRESTREIFREIERRVGGYVRGQAIMALTIGVADLVIFLLFGLPAALAVALLAGLFEIIPVFGPTLGTIPAVIVAFSYDPAKVVWVVVAGALVQLVENNVLAPRVMHKTVGVNPIVVLLAIVAFGALFGFAGLLLAIPIAAIIQILLDRSLLRPQPSELGSPLGRDRLSKLRFDVQEYVVDVRSVMQHKATGSAASELHPVEDILEGIALDLDQTLAEVAPSEGRS